MARGDPGADPIAVVDCALALQAAEAVAGAALSGTETARQPMSGIRT